MGLQPQCSGDRGWLDASLNPPSFFISVAMNVAVMTAAERDGELVADLAAEGAALCEAQVVGVAGLAPADQARLLGDMPDVIAVADPARFRERQFALVDTLRPRSSPWFCWGSCGRQRISVCRRLRFLCGRHARQLGPERLLQEPGIGCGKTVLLGQLIRGNALA